MPSEVLNDHIAGAIGGSAGLIAGHPFDTIKVQQQTQNHKGLISCFNKISTTTLSSGFFRGLSFPLLSYGFLGSIYFGAYGSALRWLREGKNDIKDKSYYWDIYLAGFIAGAAQVIPASPIEMIKVTLQSQIKSASNSKGQFFMTPWQCLKASGFRGCYRGFSSQCIRDIPSFGVYVLVYEWLHDRISEQRWADNRGVAAGLTAGGVAGVVAWGSCIPVDVVKSRLQSDTIKQYNGVMDCVIKSYRSDGLRCFWKGTVIVCLRAFPTNAIIFFVYRETLNELNKLNKVDPAAGETSESQVTCGS